MRSVDDRRGLDLDSVATDACRWAPAFGSFSVFAKAIDIVSSFRRRARGFGIPGVLAAASSAETWRKFAEQTPEPMYHGIWSASFQRDLKLEGDLLVLLQHLRCFTRQFELLRKTGVPV